MLFYDGHYFSTFLADFGPPGAALAAVWITASNSLLGGAAQAAELSTALRTDSRSEDFQELVVASTATKYKRKLRLEVVIKSAEGEAALAADLITTLKFHDFKDKSKHPKENSKHPKYNSEHQSDTLQFSKHS